MVLGALKSGVITPSNNTLTDEPIKLKGTATKSSWFNKTGEANLSLTASDALEVSSNSYMMKLAMMEGGFNDVPGSALSLSNSIFDKLRSNFKQFGLGVKTGIDIPGEAKGFEGPANQAHIGNALDLSFGNYDSYTTLQLAQYISTIANGGYRLQPHLLKSIRSTKRDGSLGEVKYEFEPNVLNVVGATDSQWNIVKEGLWKVVHGTSSYRTGTRLADIKPAVRCKSGILRRLFIILQKPKLLVLLPMLRRKIRKLRLPWLSLISAIVLPASIQLQLKKFTMRIGKPCRQVMV